MRKWWRRWRYRIGTFVAVCYITFVFGVSDYLIIMPVPGNFTPKVAHRELISVGGRNVECWVARSAAAQNEEPRAYVLEFCGNATRAEWIADYVPARWRNYPVETWVMSYPGVGGSEGRARMSAVAPGALGVYDYLAQRHRPIFVEGNSLGTTAALSVAARRDVAGCVLHDPVPLKQLLVAHYGWWNLWMIAAPVSWRVPGELDSLANAKLAKSPCVFLLAEKDELVTPKFHHLIADAYAGPKRSVLLVGKGHNDSVGSESAEEIETNLAWLWEKSFPKDH